MQEAVAQVSVELFQETQGTCSHPTRARCRLSGCSSAWTDLNQAASLHLAEKSRLLSVPLTPHAETGVITAVGSHGADVHQMTTD